jgi:hypothetical protein
MMIFHSPSKAGRNRNPILSLSPKLKAERGLTNSLSFQLSASILSLSFHERLSCFL